MLRRSLEEREHKLRRAVQRREVDAGNRRGQVLEAQREIGEGREAEDRFQIEIGQLYPVDVEERAEIHRETVERSARQREVQPVAETRDVDIDARQVESVTDRLKQLIQRKEPAAGVG